MLGALIIVFREVIEAGLIVGIVLAVTANIPRRALWVAGGIVAGVLGACLVAAFADALSNAASGVGQELFYAGILAFAVLMLAWHNIWMARHGREMAREMRAVGAAVASGERSLLALSVVVGVAVLREGSEVALFLYGLAVSGGSSAMELLVGGVAGLVLGAILTAFTYAGLVSIPSRYLFGVTTTLVTLLAAGLAAQCVLFLQQAGLAAVLEQTAWDSSWLLSDSSLPGRVLHTLVGYSDQPSVLQVIVYLATLAAILLASRLARPRAHGPPVAVVR
jgi:high-affinity iron transporter